MGGRAGSGPATDWKCASRRISKRTLTFLAILAGAALFLWPALLNGYPILFSDTGGLLEMGLLPSIGWDKPFVYGPVVALLSLHLTLWLPIAAQTLLLSTLLWMLQASHARPSPPRHLLLCLVLAAATSAPWVASTVMPDALTPIAALALIVAALGHPRHRTAAAIIAAIAIAAHLSHLVIAAALIAALALRLRRVPWRPLASLAAALLFLLASNWIGHGRPAISPYGSVFALARLIADGPARDYLAQVCPGAGYALCRWQDRLTDDSDQFLWDQNSPFWADPLPLPEFAAQASQIVAATIRAYPLRVLRDAYRNTARQLIRTDLGDTIVPDHLDAAVRPRIARWYPQAELRRYDRSAQRAGTLAPLAARLVPLHRAALLLGALSAAALLLAGLRRPGHRADLAAFILIALAANAFTGGALSTIHDRYQARIAWLILLPALLPQPSRAATASGPIRTSPA